MFGMSRAICPGTSLNLETDVVTRHRRRWWSRGWLPG